MNAGKMASRKNRTAVIMIPPMNSKPARGGPSFNDYGSRSARSIFAAASCEHCPIRRTPSTVSDTTLYLVRLGISPPALSSNVTDRADRKQGQQNNTTANVNGYCQGT